MCRIRRDNSAVIRERNVILGSDLPRVQVWLQRWREKIMRAAIKVFQLVKEEERRAFPKPS